MNSAIYNYPKDKVCPSRDILENIADKWALRIIVLLAQHNWLRFTELKKNIEGISQKMLTVTLKKLETNKIIIRKAYAEIPPRVEYSLSPLGRSFLIPLEALILWAMDNADEITR